ncbi:isoprenylcysteine carboxyl methyltransferase [Rhizobium sp. CCGE 510]|nr:isoprenylcysteine carboxyl methyltransferase [Rhizobium sp. CCGE 510]
MALSLSSLQNPIPADLVIVVFFGRTLGEEAELCKDLDGYCGAFRDLEGRGWPPALNYPISRSA